MMNEATKEQVSEPYIQRYGDIMRALAAAMGELARAKDKVGLLWACETLQVIIRASDKTFDQAMSGQTGGLSEYVKTAPWQIH